MTCLKREPLRGFSFGLIYLNEISKNKLRAKTKKQKKQNIFYIPAIIFVVLISVFVVHAFFRTSQTVPKIQPKNIPQATTTPQDMTEIRHGDRTKKQIIFTFDGGSGIQSGGKILEVLAKHHVKGTFFLTGKMMEANPILVRRIALSGHEIFNHTYDHPNLTTISDVKIVEELKGMEKVLQSIAGVSPKPYFRAPFGASDARVLAVAAKYGYRSVHWTIDAFDWKEEEGETADQVKNIILSTIAPGNIYLMHIGDNITGAILDDVFTIIESRGYKIVSLTQGL